MSERDKFLTEAMGECWHVCPALTITSNGAKGICTKCRKDFQGHNGFITYNNFSTWEGFGKLWEWSQKQEWWYDFHRQGTGICIVMPNLIHPDRFADAVYAYLKRQEGI